MAPKSPSLTFPLPRIYTTFFLTIEPISTLLGAYFAYFQPHYYLALTSPSSSIDPSDPLHLSTTIVLQQLANLYLLLSISEALVLRSTADLKVWRVFLFGLLVADAGHVWTVREAMGLAGYWRFWAWNPIDWGNLGFVYVAAGMRIAFLAGLGLPVKAKGRK